MFCRGYRNHRFFYFENSFVLISRIKLLTLSGENCLPDFDECVFLGYQKN
jgi:hypothetical protein